MSPAFLSQKPQFLFLAPLAGRERPWRVDSEVRKQWKVRCGEAGPTGEKTWAWSRRAPQLCLIDMQWLCKSVLTRSSTFFPRQSPHIRFSWAIFEVKPNESILAENQWSTEHVCRSSKDPQDAKAMLCREPVRGGAGAENWCLLSTGDELSRVPPPLSLHSPYLINLSSFRERWTELAYVFILKVKYVCYYISKYY